MIFSKPFFLLFVFFGISFSSHSQISTFTKSSDNQRDEVQNTRNNSADFVELELLYKLYYQELVCNLSSINELLVGQNVSTETSSGTDKQVIGKYKSDFSNIGSAVRRGCL